MCDSHNGYTCNFSVDRGKHGEVRSENGLGYDVVMSLMRSYFLQGYSLYVDNFYSSPKLLSDLCEQKVHSTGTLDHTRKGVPSLISSLKREFSKAKVQGGEGTYITWYLFIFHLER